MMNKPLKTWKWKTMTRSKFIKNKQVVTRDTSPNSYNSFNKLYLIFYCFLTIQNCYVPTEAMPFVLGLVKKLLIRTTRCLESLLLLYKKNILFTPINLFSDRFEICYSIQNGNHYNIKIKPLSILCNQKFTLTYTSQCKMFK